MGQPQRRGRDKTVETAKEAGAAEPAVRHKELEQTEVKMCAGSWVSCLQREAKGDREVRGQGEGLALPPGCSTTFKNRGMRGTNQRLNQINKELFPLRACGLPGEAAAVTNAAQHEELSFPSCALGASQARQPLRLLLKTYIYHKLPCSDNGDTTIFLLFKVPEKSRALLDTLICYMT